jgi:23S rRNA pseudouridine2605 synthase
MPRKPHDPSPAPRGGDLRLQAYLARAGIASRRASEELIAAGRVKVNGAVVSAPGSKVRPGVDRVSVDGSAVEQVGITWLALNKPRGYVTTRNDPYGRRTVYELLPEKYHTLFHVGRLDRDSEGLLLLTNDGEMANRMLHPSFGTTKEYLADVEGQPESSTVSQLLAGVDLEDGLAKAEEVQRLHQTGPDTYRLRIVLREGKKREIRRMMDAVGHPVHRLMRQRFGPVELGELPSGKFRVLGPTELSRIREGGVAKRKKAGAVADEDTQPGMDTPEAKKAPRARPAARGPGRPSLEERRRRSSGRTRRTSVRREAGGTIGRPSRPHHAARGRRAPDADRASGPRTGREAFHRQARSVRQVPQGRAEGRSRRTGRALRARRRSAAKDRAFREAGGRVGGFGGAGSSPACHARPVVGAGGARRARSRPGFRPSATYGPGGGGRGRTPTAHRPSRRAQAAGPAGRSRPPSRCRGAAGRGPRAAQRVAQHRQASRRQGGRDAARRPRRGGGRGEAPAFRSPGRTPEGGRERGSAGRPRHRAPAGRPARAEGRFQPGRRALAGPKGRGSAGVVGPRARVSPGAAGRRAVRCRPAALSSKGWRLQAWWCQAGGCEARRPARRRCAPRPERPAEGTGPHVTRLLARPVL